MDDKKPLYECARRLCGPEFKPFTQWLASELADVTDRLIAAPDTHVARLQGDALRIKRILDLIGSSSDVLNKLEGR